MVLCIGGCDVADVYDLCEHAEKIGVDCITLLPDLFYKPRIEEDLVEYFKDVCKRCPTRPIYYYHIPEYTRVKLNLVRFYELVGKCCQNFCGIFYRHADIEIACDLFKSGCQMICCTDTLLPGLMTLGLNSFCVLSLNICPERVYEIYEHMCNLKLREAYDVYNKYYEYIKEICNNRITYCDWVELYKRKFNKVVDFNVGDLRKPRCTFRYEY
jgi:N-acetylneuraminate lyase